MTDPDRIEPPTGDTWLRRATPDRIAGAALVLLGLIHLAPAVGALGDARLAALYGIAVDGPDLSLLLRHRAVLFALLGGYMLWSVARPAHRSMAFFFAFANIAGFLALAWRIGDLNAALGRVAIVDAVALAILAIGAAAHVVARDAG